MVQCMPPPATPATALCHLPTPSDSIDYFPPTAAAAASAGSRRLQGGPGLGDDDPPPGVGVASGDICATPSHTLGSYSSVGQGGTPTTATLLNLATLGMDLGVPPLFLPMPAVALTITGTIRTKVGT